MSTEVFIYLISAIVLISSLCLMVKTLGYNFILTLPGFFYVYFVIFIFLGSPFYFIYQGMNNTYYITATHLVLLIFPIGIIISNRIMNVDFKTQLNKYFNMPIIDNQPGKEFLIIFIIILSVTLAVTMLYFSKLDEIPINYFFRSLANEININELAKLREASTTTFNIGKLHRYKYFMAQLLPFLVVISFLKSRISQRKLWYSILVLLTLFTMYRFVSDLQKKPILDFIILLFITSWILRGKINWKQIGILFSLLLSMLGLMYYYIMGMGDRPFYVLIDAVFSRLILGQTMPLYHYFTLFPNVHDFLYGTSLPNPAGLFPFENFPITKWVFVNGLNRSWEIVGTAPSAFVGEIYANFGYPIMLLSILVLAISLQMIQIQFISKPRTLLLTAFYSYFVYLSSQFALTGAFVVVHVYLIIFLLVAILFRDGYKILHKVLHQ